MDKEFFEKWFNGFDEGLSQLKQEECSKLFSKCAQQCSCDALKYLYKDLFNECNEDLDKFFLRLNEKKDLEEKVIEPGKIYELIFTKCGCPLYTHAKINSNNLCECSRQSMICVFKNLVPQKNFKIECTESILAGNKKCCHKIVFDD